MIFNLSNRSVNNWSKSELSEAKSLGFGRLVDHEMISNPYELGVTYCSLLADEFARGLSRESDGPSAVILGSMELSFAVALIKSLQSFNFRCYSGVFDDSGEFIRFRECGKIC